MDLVAQETSCWMPRKLVYFTSEKSSTFQSIFNVAKLTTVVHKALCTFRNFSLETSSPLSTSVLGDGCCTVQSVWVGINQLPALLMVWYRTWLPATFVGSWACNDAQTPFFRRSYENSIRLSALQLHLWIWFRLTYQCKRPQLALPVRHNYLTNMRHFNHLHCFPTFVHTNDVHRLPS